LNIDDLPQVAGRIATLPAPPMIDRGRAEVIEFYATRHDADRELAEILHDEPSWTGRFEIAVVDFSGAEPTVKTAG